MKHLNPKQAAPRLGLTPEQITELALAGRIVGALLIVPDLVLFREDDLAFADAIELCPVVPAEVHQAPASRAKRKRTPQEVAQWKAFISA